MNKKEMTRRRFLGSTAIAASVFSIVPRHVLGGIGFTAPSDKLNVATVGVGGMGADNTMTIAGLGYDEETLTNLKTTFEKIMESYDDEIADYEDTKIISNGDVE